jgi:polyisoprenoid-binding protein YceI
MAGVGFSVRHLMSRVRGTFDRFTGQIVTEDDVTRSMVTAVIEMSSVNTGLELRDNHLRSGEFFGVADNPTMGADLTGVNSWGLVTEGSKIMVGDRVDRVGVA